ncbi:tRNA threonylcarbamoyladenosine dehydratase [uncultured Ilyobacter sp.]|jgi:tRNA A37 threonylcarbamoyladenosine dehydratase|uniref:tRNA threonylcarbamoyladenosine dehydratase n=1 Tax=uncultured Ilyobacter sp. TaxID=544433 RepID=UPI0029C02577|nr:tRNA threonylcarbamoyladenosine dehydratase [uncultured Ilyobacter sp.]
MQFQRLELLIGKEKIEKLKNSHVIIFGLGGVGGFTVEALVRAGIGEISVVDFDSVDITNLNRQIIATHESIGRKKADLIKERALSINPKVKINSYIEKYSKETEDMFFKNKDYDYAVDAIDLVSCKLDLIEICKKKNIPVISSMGTGNKLNPTMLEVADISKTSVCPLAKVMRKELKKRRIGKVKVIFSKEVPKKPLNDENSREKKVNVGSVSFVPSVAGLIIASEVTKDICRI